MGADNWTYCPNCKTLADEQTRLLAKKVTDSYGKVPSDEYLAMLKTLQAKPELEETFREDFQIGICEGGTFVANYHGRCERCDAHFDYEHLVPRALKLN